MLKHLCWDTLQCVDLDLNVETNVEKLKHVHIPTEIFQVYIFALQQLRK